ncbi:hypothetical protein [Xanthomonas sp. XNM01]|uniref:hypothetical protein n=1 Tax=Xanthomonas sp. XNM01 TaxID=2769289 RepID=UPI00177B0EA7|nr:hypothetical protein [Xanthomonas sp. XNM01]
MTTPPKRPTALFSPSRSYSDDQGPPRAAGGRLGGQEWVVPRAECQYRQQDFSKVSPRQRAAAARLAIPRLEPAPGARVHVAWQGAVAHYWIWTPGQLEADARRYRRWLPESRLYAPLEDGIRLLRVHQGFEGQIWKGGTLAFDQWWSGVPDLRAWQHFLRSGGLDVGSVDQVPQPASLAWEQVPWGDAGGGFTVDAAMAERMAWWGVATLLACGLGWQAMSLLRWQSAVSAEGVRLEAARSEALPLLDARERAERAASEIESWSALQPGISDYALMLDVTAILPEDARLSSWSREADKLRTIVLSRESDPRRFIAPFAQSTRFSNVVATPTGAGGMLIEFELAQSDAVGVVR